MTHEPLYAIRTCPHGRITAGCVVDIDPDGTVRWFEAMSWLSDGAVSGIGSTHYRLTTEPPVIEGCKPCRGADGV